MEVLDRIKNNLIVSLQATSGEPLYDEDCMIAMAKSVVTLGGATCLRLAGKRDIKNIKELFPDIIVIGITKPKRLPRNYKEVVYITPTIEDCKEVIDAGADIVAFDATKRPRPKDEKLSDIIQYIKAHNRLAMADVATFSEAKRAYRLKADIISTTLSGHTLETQDRPEGPDFELLRKIIINIPVFTILEGGIWSTQDITKAFKLGADSVVVGSAITRPQLITKRFLEAVKDATR